MRRARLLRKSMTATLIAGLLLTPVFANPAEPLNLQKAGWRLAQQGPPKGQNSVNSEDIFGIMDSVAIRFGNFRAGHRFTGDLLKALESAPKTPETQAEFAAAKLVLKLAGCINLAFSGEANNAIREIEPLIPEIEKLQNPEVTQAAYAVLVYAGKQSRQLTIFDKYFPALQASVSKSVPPKRALYQFVLESWKFERELEKSGDVSNAVFMERARVAHKILADYRIEGDTQTEGRLYGSAFHFWIGETVYRLNDKKVDPNEKAELQKLATIFNQQLMAYAQTAIDNPNPLYANPEFTFVFLDETLRLVDYLAYLQEFEMARSVLTTLEQPMNYLKTTLPKFDQEWLKLIDTEVLSKSAQLSAVFASAGMKYDASSWRFSLLEGDFSKLTANYHRSWERLLRAEAKAGKKSAGDIDGHLASATHYQNLLEKGQGYQGLEDIGWDKIRVHLERRPKNWANLVQGEISRQRQLSQRLQYRPGLIESYILEGEALLLQNKKSESQRTLQTAINQIEVYLNEVGGGSSNPRIRREYQKAYDLLTQLQLEQGKARDAYGTLGRAQQVSSVLTTSDKVRGQMGQLQTLRTQANTLERELVKRRENQQDTKLVEELLAKNKAEFHSTLNLLRQKNPAYESVLAIRPVNFSKQQQFIPADTAVIQYFPTDSALYIFVATQSDLKIRRVNVGRGQLYDTIQGFRKNLVESSLRELEKGQSPKANWTQDSPLKRDILTLYGALVEPVEPDIADKQVVAFIPTGPLNYIPMQALAKAHPQKGLEFIVERKQCVVLLKSSDIDQLSRSNRSGQGVVFAIGNPDGTLKSAEKEVEAISSAFPGSKSFVGREATLEKFKQMDEKVSYVHLATHGQLDSSDPNATYLVLAGPNEASRLRLPQIYDLKFDKVRLVTLSACDTAIGEREPGSELTSLADAFSVAGSNSVVASLWPVADSSTQILMEHFYTGLRDGKSISAALQAAEVKVLSDPKTAHPFYWAPFTLIGDWR